jgi:DNA invertase Pin-like site-specific DNA recombinase
MNMKKVLYVRVSTVDQKTDRQRVNESAFDLVIEDKVSGSVAFFEREGGKQIKQLIDKGVCFQLFIYSIDRAGRDLRDIINTIHYFNQHGICCEFISQGIRTLDDEGNENAISKLMISILGTVAEMNRVQIRENQMSGIRIAKLNGTYKGRKPGSKEDVLTFLSKPKNKKAIELLKLGNKAADVAAAAKVHINTVTKIKKLSGLTHL